MLNNTLYSYLVHTLQEYWLETRSNVRLFIFQNYAEYPPKTLKQYSEVENVNDLT